MKATLFIVLFSLSLVLAQPGGTPLASWAGSTIGVNTTWLEPDVSSSTFSCSNSTGNYTYAAFSFIFASTRIRQVIALGSSLSVFVLNGTVNPLNPCPNVVAELFANNRAVGSYGPSVEDSFVFQSNVTYWFVVSASSPTDFALAIYDVLATGTTAGANTWSPVYFDSPTTCTQASANVPYAKFAWTQNSTGLFDITVGFAVNTTVSFGTDTYIALFRTNVSSAAISSDTLCNPSNNANLIYATHEYPSLSGHLFGVQLVSGIQYTIVASGDDTDSYANYGVTVAQSRILPAVFIPVEFLQPQISLPCAPSPSYTNSSFAAVAATSASNNYKVVYSFASLNSGVYSNWTTSAGDTAAFVYQGLNVGTNVTAPLTCPTVSASLADASTGFPASLDISPNTVYSFVPSYWGSSGDSGEGEFNAFLAYVLTGAPAGNVNTSTGASTTGTGSATGGATNGGIANGGHSSTTNFTGSTTNAGSAVVSSIVFVVLAILALLF